MTLEEARTLALLLSDVPDDWPVKAQTLCTCCMCMEDYAERLNYAFPSFVWETIPDTEETQFSTLTVRAKEAGDGDTAHPQ